MKVVFDWLTDTKERQALVALLPKLRLPNKKLIDLLSKQPPLELAKRCKITANQLVKIDLWLQQESANLIILGDKHYPAWFLDLKEPPVMFLFKGDYQKFYRSRCIGVVGSRKPTFYGRQMTKEVVRVLVELGFVVVSGLALGIDGLAHAEAISLGGLTGAVIPTGLDNIYPKSHRNLSRQIVSSGGFVLTETAFGAGTLNRWSFWQRNRLIAALSEKVIIIQGSKRSGTLITASQALDLGRDIYAVPGDISQPLSWAPNFLVQQGAKPIIDITEFYRDLSDSVGYPRPSTAKKELNSRQLTIDEDQIVNRLNTANQPAGIDELVAWLGWPATKTLRVVSSLELKGIIEADIDGKYHLSIS